jgi:hypothetical protein
MKDSILAKIYGLDKLHPAYHGLVALYKNLEWLKIYQPDNWERMSSGERAFHENWRDERIKSTRYCIYKLLEK